MIKIKIDGQEYQAKEGESVLQVAMREGLDIPHLCYHEDLPIEANCRLCLVKVNDRVETSCNLKVREGLEVFSQDQEITELRQENLELLLGDHEKNCPKCQENLPCPAKKLMEKYGVSGNKYPRRQLETKVEDLGTAAEFDPEMCVNCNRCVNTCSKIGINYLEIEGKAAQSQLTATADQKIDCIYCGQCTVHCPVSAVREKNHLKRVEEVLADQDKILIAQMAPSVRASIGEEFGLPVGSDVTGQMYTALRQLGFDYIFDVNFGADITTMIEAQELVERIKDDGVLPMFTSCCPAWVKFVEFYYPDLIPHLTTSRSPQIHSGGAYKTWWASQQGINPEKIVVVSIMPCTSKKYEADLNKFDLSISNSSGESITVKPVDMVLTTRETAALLKKQQIDLKQLEPSQADSLGEHSGAAAIYGASGGVMESALRTAAKMLTGQDLARLEFDSVRGMNGLKKALVRLDLPDGQEIKLKVAVVSTPKNARIVINELKKDPRAYDYIEFMACPGGCIGGGGQPLTSTEAIVAERIKALYQIDQNKKMRTAHANPLVKEFLDYLEHDELGQKIEKQVLHTSYEAKKRGQ